MADLAPTQVEVPSGVKHRDAVAGEVIALGELICLPTDSTDNKRFRTDEGDATKRDIEGIALTPGALNGTFIFALLRDEKIVIDLGVTTVQAQEYVMSTTLGKIALRTDLTTTDNLIVVGQGNGNNGIRFNVDNTGIVVP